MRIPAVLAFLTLATPAAAAWFSDNGTREALLVLRAKPEASLTATEREILTAANRIGWIEIPECGRGSNAVLISVDGQDYAVTSLHLLTGKAPGEVYCEPGMATQFLPNAAYIHPETPVAGGDEVSAPPDFAWDRVTTDPEPLNFTRSGAAMPWVSDWVAYRLREPVSGQIMPEGAWGAGAPRGAMPWSEAAPPGGPVWVIGFDGRFALENGWQFSWQGCEQHRTRYENGLLYFSCDVSPGASSSLIATMEEGRFTFQGIITASMEPMTGTDVPLPASALLWNIGTTAAGIREKLDPQSLSEKIGWSGLWR